LKTLSEIFAKALSFLVPTVVGTIFFFVIIGVFGLGFAIAGLLVTVTGAVIIVRRLPAEGDAR
jgi:hypothetical protein